MKRPVVTAQLLDSAGAVILEGVRYAWNSGVRETEALLRQYARENDLVFHGSLPEVVRSESGREYRREWTSHDGRTVWALVTEVEP